MLLFNGRSKNGLPLLGGADVEKSGFGSFIILLRIFMTNNKVKQINLTHTC